MNSLFSALVAIAVLGGVHAQINLPTVGDFFEVKPTFHDGFPRTPCLTVFSAANGSALVIEDCSVSTEQRIFEFTQPAGTTIGQIQIFNTFCLQAPQATNGAKVNINSCDGTAGQQWVWNTHGQIKWAGTQDESFCLDLTDGNLNNGNQLQIWQCDDSLANRNQIWSTAAILQPISEVVNTAASGSSLCMAANSTANGAPVFAVPCDDTTSRKVWNAPQPGHGNTGLYQLAFGDDGAGPVKCLDVTDGIDAPGTKLQVWDCTDGPNQRWLPTGQIRWNGIAQNFPMCVDLTDGNVSPGNQLQIWNCTDGNTNQFWTPIAPSPQTAV
ncbi:carbohydrate-binding module family 13 protein [Sphaerobolus stellatus SS14]|nr:carbohydrate-binding module family 13 protein [Sphaerobolus stellatus SS14]